MLHMTAMSICQIMIHTGILMPPKTVGSMKKNLGIFMSSYIGTPVSRFVDLQKILDKSSFKILLPLLEAG